MNKEQYLRELYYNPDSPVAYSNIRNIWKKIKEDKKSSNVPKVKYSELKEFLPEQPTYTKHKRTVEKLEFSHRKKNHPGVTKMQLRPKMEKKCNKKIVKENSK